MNMNERIHPNSESGFEHSRPPVAGDAVADEDGAGDYDGADCRALSKG